MLRRAQCSCVEPSHRRQRRRASLALMAGAALALACGGGDDLGLSASSAAPSAPGTSLSAVGGTALAPRSARALALIGGQTGSDIVPEAPQRCAVTARADYELAAPTPLGFPGADIAAALSPRAVALRWADGSRSEGTLSFEVRPRVTVLHRAGDVPGCVDVLRLELDVALSSEESGLAGRWHAYVYAESATSWAGLGSAEASELGGELRARAGGDGLELLVEAAPDALRGWLSTDGDPPDVIAEIGAVE